MEKTEKSSSRLKCTGLQLSSTPPSDIQHNHHFGDPVPRVKFMSHLTHWKPNYSIATHAEGSSAKGRSHRLVSPVKYSSSPVLGTQAFTFSVVLC